MNKTKAITGWLLACSLLVCGSGSLTQAGISEEFYVEGVVVSILPKEIRVARSGSVWIVPKRLIPKETQISANAPISIALGWQHLGEVKTARTPASLSEADATRRR